MIKYYKYIFKERVKRLYQFIYTNLIGIINSVKF